ncbi:MAG: Xaa-Pro peptidase family protein [Nanoarchaeota archaeon]|nr:Xaa-Pro peptidase family protein [Nanoarchaeota archaeon]
MKIKQLQSLLQEKKIDLFLAASIDFERPDPELTYFTNFRSVGVLAIPKKGKPLLVVPQMEAKAAKAAKNNKVQVVFPKEKKPLLTFLAEQFKKQKINPKKIALNNTEVTLQLKDILKKTFKASFVDLGPQLATLRATKTKEEIAIIKQGYKISDTIFEKGIKQFKKGKTETDIAAFFEYEAKKQGCDLAFPVIVASGKRAAEVHHVPIKKRLLQGFCVIDFGIKHKNYCTDTTRTVFLGTPSKKEIQIYNRVLEAQKKAISSCKPQAQASKIVEQVNKDLGAYAELFTHGLGHGFGIKIHEQPNLKPDSKEVLEENMLVTIEPGIYKDFGIRIEDGVLITKTGHEILSKFPKKLLAIR